MITGGSSWSGAEDVVGEGPSSLTGHGHGLGVMVRVFIGSEPLDL